MFDHVTCKEVQAAINSISMFSTSVVSMNVSWVVRKN